MFDDEKSGMFFFGLGLGVVGLITVLVFFWIFGGPLFNVYAKKLEGEAKLKEAESSRQIAVLEAKAKLESSKSLADAEVQRANGVAQANKIIGDSLRDNPAYLNWLYINNLEDKQGQDRTVIYVPTQNGIPSLPVTESPRLQQPVK